MKVAAGTIITQVTSHYYIMLMFLRTQYQVIVASTGTMDTLQHWIAETEWKTLEKSRPLLARLKSSANKHDSANKTKSSTGENQGDQQTISSAIDPQQLPLGQRYHLDHTRKRVFRLARTSGVLGKFRIKCKLTMSDSEFYSIFQKFDPVLDLSLASWASGFTPVKGFAKPVSLAAALKGKGPFLDVRRATATENSTLHDWCAFEDFPPRHGGRGGMITATADSVIAVVELVAVLSISKNRLVGQQIQAYLFITTVRFNLCTRALSFSPKMDSLEAFGGTFIESIRSALVALNQM